MTIEPTTIETQLAKFKWEGSNETWTYGITNHGVGVFRDFLSGTKVKKWFYTVTLKNDNNWAIGIGPYNSKKEAMLAGLKDFNEKVAKDPDAYPKID